MTNFQEYIKPELLILIPVLYLIGMGIKKSKIKDTLIPVILGAIGVILAALYVFASAPVQSSQDLFTGIFMALTQGVLCAGASVYINQIIKQATKED